MDGLKTIDILTRDMLRLFDRKVSTFAIVLRKSQAIHKIKIQPFFGDYWETPSTITRIKIRRPVEYKRIENE